LFSPGDVQVDSSTVKAVFEPGKTPQAMADSMSVNRIPPSDWPGNGRHNLEPA